MSTQEQSEAEQLYDDHTESVNANGTDDAGIDGSEEAVGVTKNKQSEPFVLSTELITQTGFKVPETYDCIDVLVSVRKWTEIPVAIEVGFIFLYSFLFLFSGLPKSVLFYSFL
jgi:hypothetical protein